MGMGVRRLRDRTRLGLAASMLVLSATAACSDASPVADVTVCSPSQCASSRAVVSPVFAIGTDPDGALGGLPFAPASEGSEFTVVKGTQGAFMIVLSAATNRFDCCVERVNIRASLTTVDCGRKLGESNLRRRLLAHGDDGLGYILNTFLIVGPEGTWEEEQAVLTLSLEPYGGGETFDQTLTVMLNADRGGSPPPPLRFGTSEAGETRPDGFCALPDYALLTAQPLSDGQPGLLFAARTAAFGPDVAEVDIDATLIKSVKVDPTCESTETTTCPMVDVELGRVVGRRHPIVRRDSGRAYVLGIPVPLNADAEWAGEAARLTLTLAPAGGGEPVTSSASLMLLAPPG